MTTTSPVVPVGTAAIKIPDTSVLVTVWVFWWTSVAVTPPIVTPVIVVDAPAFLADAATMIYLSAEAAPKLTE